MKRQKVLDIHTCGLNLKGYFEEGKTNPWRLYRVWWDRGEHREMLVKYANFISLVQHVEQLFHNRAEAWED